MAFEIRWKPKALEDLEKLPKPTKKRIMGKVEFTSIKPERTLDWIKKYHVNKLRVGDYRIFIDLDHKKNILEVLLIRHRSKAYKSLR